MKKTALLLLSFALAGAGAGLLMRPAETVLADAPAANTQLELKQTAFDGDGKEIEVTVPVFYDGSQYILADYTRNIYVLDGSNAAEESDYYYRNLPEYISSNGIFDDKMAVTIYATSIKSYDFYTEENVGKLWKGVNGNHNDKPFDWTKNSEVPLYVIPHANITGYIDNAMFNKATIGGITYGYMIVGDGGTQYSLQNQGKAMDVIAHEYQHGVSWAMNNKNLSVGGGLGTVGYAGALNEAVSDIFGILIEGKDINSDDFWTLGEDNDGGIIRSIQDPKLAGNSYASTVRDRVKCPHGTSHTQSCDWGNVHYNSTIFSHLQYTAWELNPKFFTPERIGTLWFEMLNLFNADTVMNEVIDENCFTVFANKMLQAAQNLNFEPQGKEALRYALVKNGFPVTGYKESDTFYKVTFLDDDNKTVLGYSYVRAGETASAPAVTKAPTATTRYEATWSASLENVNSDFTVTASYTAVERVRVQYYDFDGNLISEGYIGEETGAEPNLTLPEGTDENEYQLTWEETTVNGVLQRKAVLKKKDSGNGSGSGNGDGSGDGSGGGTTGDGNGSGCGSVIGVGAAAVAAGIILGGSMFLLKRKNKNNL